MEGPSRTASTSPSPMPPASRGRSAPSRRDGRRSRDRLLRAAGELLSTGQPFSLTDVAVSAGVSTATAYRHFGSARQVADVYVAGFLDDVQRRRPAALSGQADPGSRVAALCRAWVDAVLEWGPALTHLRSTEGFLARLRRGDKDMLRAAAFIEPDLADLLDTDIGSAQLSYALLIWNALSDPREILDQRHTLDWTAAYIAARLHSALCAIADSSTESRPRLQRPGHSQAPRDSARRRSQ